MPILSTARETLTRIDALIRACTVPRHRLMLSAFRAHWHGEVTCDLDAAMTVLPENSFFFVTGAIPAGHALEAANARDHRAIYQQMLDMGLNPGGAFSSERFAFAEWGMIMEAVYSNVVYGHMLAMAAREYDARSLYLFHAPMIMVCLFSPSGQMLGKRDYMGLATAIEPADEGTLERLMAL